MTQLMRTALRPLYKATRDAHPGLMIQRGYQVHEGGGSEAKTQHIAQVCGIPASDFYVRAFRRWRAATEDARRFHSIVLTLETRLFIGLTGGGALETGCAIAHTYGVPFIPGSSIKGVVNAYVKETPFGQASPAICGELFGTEPTDENPAGLSGLLRFHDAWWVPDSAECPLVQEVVTTHHLEYYGSEGETPATDLDSPVPNAQIAVHGSFLFVMEGPLAWMPLGADMLVAALRQAGLGAKTRSGYGLFQPAPAVSNDGPRCDWVDDTIAILAKKNNAKGDDTLRSKGLAAEWKTIADAELKAQALVDIKARWDEQGWWESPPGGSAQKAKEIYTEA